MRSLDAWSVAALVSLLGAPGCGATAPPRFIEPESRAPHAAVTLRVAHETQPDQFSEENIELNGLPIDVPDGNRRASGVSLGFRAPPGATQWRLGTSFYHFETRWVTETYLDYESTYDSCASRDSRGSCRGGSKSRTVTKTRTVPRTVRVSTASCTQAADFELDAGAAYTLSFRFHADRRCTLECIEASRSPGEGAQGAPCKTARVEAEKSGQPGEAKKPRAEGASSSPLGTAAITLGALGLTGAAMAGLYALAMKDEVDAHCDADRTCDAQGRDAAEKGRTAVGVGTISGVAGAALLASGIVLLSVGPREKPPAASLRASPTAQGGQLSLEGRF